MPKKIYIFCYDISNRKIRNKIQKAIQKHAIRGQYSAYECYFSQKFKDRFEHDLQAMIEENDTLKVQVIHNTKNIINLGVAQNSNDINFTYFG